MPRICNRAFVHHTAGARLPVDVFRTHIIERGWSAPGYHLLVGQDGTLYRLLPDSAVANGVKGLNADSLHLAFAADLTAERASPAAVATATRAIAEWCRLHQFDPQDIMGHGSAPGAHTECPGSLDVEALRSLVREHLARPEPVRLLEEAHSLINQQASTCDLAPLVTALLQLITAAIGALRPAPPEPVPSHQPNTVSPPR